MASAKGQNAGDEESKKIQFYVKVRMTFVCLEGERLTPKNTTKKISTLYYDYFSKLMTFLCYTVCITFTCL